MIDIDQQYVLNTYKRLPIDVSYAKGSYIYTKDGKKYLDMYAGIAVMNLGHQHPAIKKAMKKQMNKFLHLSNYFATEPVINLAKLLVENSFASKVFFTNSGTEAIEASIKLARKWGRSIDIHKIEMISLDQSFHGRTMGGLSLTGQPKYQKDYAPLLSHIKQIKRNSIDELRKSVSHHTCALYLELIQGESGVEPLDETFINEAIKLSKIYHFLIVADEIQTGLLRTGQLFAYQHTKLIPDILTLAKSLGGGLPLGAMLVSNRLENVLSYGDHGSTFGGNPLAASLGVATLKILLTEKFQTELLKNSEYLFNQLKDLEKQTQIIKQIRGKGLMIGIDVGSYAQEIQVIAQSRGILLNITNQNVIRLLPALNISKKEIDQFIYVFKDIVTNILNTTKKNG